MAFDAFLKLGDIVGSSTDSSHKGWIVLESYGIGLEQAGGSVGSGSSAGRTEFSEFTFVARDAPAAVPVLDSSVKGLRQNAELHLTTVNQKTGETQVYASYKLTNCIVTSVRDAGSVSDQLPAQAVSLSYQKAEITNLQVNKTAIFDNTGGTK